MKANLENAQNANKMVRGENPFDAGKASPAFSQWEETAQKLPTLFPEPPKPGEDTRALPKIWESKADFETKIAPRHARNVARESLQQKYARTAGQGGFTERMARTSRMG
jgi:cytochrome c556